MHSNQVHDTIEISVPDVIEMTNNVVNQTATHSIYSTFGIIINWNNSDDSWSIADHSLMAYMELYILVLPLLDSIWWVLGYQPIGLWFSTGPFNYTEG